MIETLIRNKEMFPIDFIHTFFIPLEILMQLGDIQTVIFDRGCLRSGEEWVERNLVPVAGVAVALAVLQVC